MHAAEPVWVGGLQVPAASNADTNAKFRAWIEPHWVVMQRVAARLASPNDVDDVLQASLLSAWRHRDQYDESRGSVRAWLLAITTNEARRSHRGKSHFSPLAADRAMPETDSVLDMDLQRAVKALPRRQRQAIELHYYVGLNVHEVAEVMRCADGTVKATLAAARDNLEIRLREDENER